MITAGKARCIATLPGDERIAAVRTDVVKGAQLAVLAACDQRRTLAQFNLANHEIAGLCHILFASDTEPGTPENICALKFEKRLRREQGGGDGFMAEKVWGRFGAGALDHVHGWSYALKSFEVCSDQFARDVEEDLRGRGCREHPAP